MQIKRHIELASHAGEVFTQLVEHTTHNRVRFITMRIQLVKRFSVCVIFKHDIANAIVGRHDVQLTKRCREHTRKKLASGNHSLLLVAWFLWKTKHALTNDVALNLTCSTPDGFGT